MNQVLLGLIDTRIDLLNPAFLDTSGQQFRWRGVWDLASEAIEGPWMAPVSNDPTRGQANGRLLDTAACTPGTFPHTAQGYQQLFPGETRQHRRLARHGTGVARMLGGRHDAWTGRADEASDLPLAAVMLSPKQLDQSHGQWLATAVLSGLHYLLGLRQQGEVLVVNLSVTGGTGPRLGGSLQMALDQLIARERGRLIVVVAAGNERRQNAHLAGPLAPGQSLEFSLFLPDQRSQATYLDWTAIGANDPDAEVKVGWSAWRDSDAPPRGDLGPGQGRRLDLDPGAPGTAMAWVAQHVLSTKVKAQGLWVVSPMKTPRAQQLAGRWHFRLVNQGPQPVEVHSWLARNDRPGRDRHPAVRFDAPGHRADTLAALACAERVIRVGGYLPLDDRRGILYPDAGSGGSMCPPPDVGGLAQWQASRDGDLGPTGRGGRERGTSLAAPFVARRLARALAAAQALPTDKQDLLDMLRGWPQMQVLAGDTGRDETLPEVWLAP